jgi:hypothetical protein
LDGCKVWLARLVATCVEVGDMVRLAGFGVAGSSGIELGVKLCGVTALIAGLQPASAKSVPRDINNKNLGVSLNIQCPFSCSLIHEQYYYILPFYAELWIDSIHKFERCPNNF